VEAVERLVYDGLVLEETARPPRDRERASELLFEAAVRRGPDSFAPEGALVRLAARIAFVAAHLPEAGLVAPGEAEVRAALRELCEGRLALAELEPEALARAGEPTLLERLLAGLLPEQATLLARMAPERVTLAGGRNLRVDYPGGAQAPYVASRLQDFFGSREGPRVLGGRVPLVLHLLAPNQRPVQLTTDLAGFWQRVYPSLRRELGRRYPRHPWPEDPLAAEPPAPGGGRPRSPRR
jgi:ATP-dependent helicase HrpB